ncbi:hypothetical protein [Alistipes putredinis]|uniref:hypothetical protein n=1 Tax=Alistipes putredinis TaxID=28117 RepID=UPI003FD70DE0
MKTIDFLCMTKAYELPYGSYALINAAIDGLCVLAAPTETPVTLSCTPAMTAALRSGKDAPTACFGDNDAKAREFCDSLAARGYMPDAVVAIRAEVGKPLCTYLCYLLK